jgi:hypothetical protein
MKKIILVLFCLTLTAAVGWAQFSDGYDYQPFMDSIQKTIEQAVGAKSEDRIPGQFSHSSPVGTFKAEAIECPKSIADVKQAADLLQARLSSDFTNRVVSISRQSPSQGGDTTTLDASLCDAKLTNKVVSVNITISKRSSGHVVLFLVYSAVIGYGGG